MGKSLTILELLSVAALASAGPIMLKDGSLCVDSAGADRYGQVPLKAAQCTKPIPAVSSQSFYYDKVNRYVEVSTNPNLCWEDFWGDGHLTLFDKTDPRFEPNDKHFHWDSTSGAITREGNPNCVTATSAGTPLTLTKCTGAANQQWTVDWSPAPGPAPAPAPSRATCAKIGCIAYKRGLPCQCNRDCHTCGNCCSDFDATCKKIDDVNKTVHV